MENKNKNNEKYVQGELFDGWMENSEKIDEMMKDANSKINHSGKKIPKTTTEKSKPKQRWGLSIIILSMFVLLLALAYMPAGQNVEGNKLPPPFSEKI